MNRLETTQVKIAIARAFAVCKRNAIRAVEILVAAGIWIGTACRMVTNLQGA